LENLAIRAIVRAMESLHEFPVCTRRGHALVVTLGVVACIVLVAAGVTIFAGAPPEIEGWKWPMTAVGLVALVATFVVHRGRRRLLRIVHGPDGHHLIVDREDVRLEFPLRITGEQHTNSVNGIPMYEVWLKLGDARTGVFFTETRGTIHGPEDDWLSNMDASPAPVRFESGAVGMLAKLRAVVEQINERAR
jgi:hypothetical protein